MTQSPTDPAPHPAAPPAAEVTTAIVTTRNKPRRRTAMRRVGVVLMALVLWYLAHLCLIAWVGVSDTKRSSDVAVIFGNLVMPDGTPSHVLQARLDRGLRLHREGMSRAIIVSGAASETPAMYRYLRRQGVPAAALFEDPAGKNTYYTAWNTRRIMRENNFTSVTAVSQFYHVLRIRLAFWRMGISNVRSTQAAYTEEWPAKWMAREFAGFYRYVFRLYPSRDPTPQELAEAIRGNAPVVAGGGAAAE